MEKAGIAGMGSDSYCETTAGAKTVAEESKKLVGWAKKSLADLEKRFVAGVPKDGVATDATKIFLARIIAARDVARDVEFQAKLLTHPDYAKDAKFLNAIRGRISELLAVYESLSADSGTKAVPTDSDRETGEKKETPKRSAKKTLVSDTGDFVQKVRDMLAQERCFVQSLGVKNEAAWLSAIDALDIVNTRAGANFDEAAEKAFSDARERLDVERLRGGYASHRVFDIVSNGNFLKGGALKCGGKRVSA
jgi:hypothetical protein